MMTGKERAALRAIASNLDTVVMIGKGGITENVVSETEAALNAHELVKFKVLENSLLTAREACDALSELTRAEQIQVIGSKFVLYRANPKLPAEKRIDFRK